MNSRYLFICEITVYYYYCGEGIVVVLWVQIIRDCGAKISCEHQLMLVVCVSTNQFANERRVESNVVELVIGACC